MAKIISVFSHKGGVGKTTFVYNLAYQLACKNKKVLLIDADSQMNLTASVHGMSHHIEYLTKNGQDWMNELDQHLNLNEFLKKHNVLPAEDGEVFDKQVFSKSVNEFNEKIKEKNTGIEFKNTKSIKIDILAGSISIIEAENKLYKFENNEDRPKKFQSALKNLSEGYDFVLIDTSPSAGSSVNALIVFSSDYFVISATPTFFSRQAVDNMTYILEDWATKLQTPSARYGFLRDAKFLGIVFQMAKRFKQKNKDRGKEDITFTKSAEYWIELINESVKKFQTEAQRNKWSIDEKTFRDIFGLLNDAFIIEKCCDFTPKLRSLAEKFGVPIVALKDISHKDVANTINLIQYQKALDATIESYDKIADGFIKLLDLKVN